MSVNYSSSFINKSVDEYIDQLKNHYEHFTEDYISNSDKQLLINDIVHKIIATDFLPSKLDGNTTSYAFISVIQDFKALRNKYKEEQREADLEVINKTITLYKKSFFQDVRLHMTRRYKNPIQKKNFLEWHCAELAAELRALPVGEKLLIQGGTPSHAILYEITRAEDETLDFQIINSGQGLENHSFRFRNGNYQIQGIREDVFTPDFFVKLLEVRLFSSKMKPQSVNHKIKEFFRGCQKFLFRKRMIDKIYHDVNQELIVKGGGQRVIPIHRKNLHKPQKGGTCTRKQHTYKAKDSFDAIQYMEFKVISTENALKRLRALGATANLPKKPTLISRFKMKRCNDIPLNQLYQYGLYNYQKRQKKLQDLLFQV